MAVVDLDNFRTAGVRVFSGRGRGAAVRERAHLADLEQASDEVIVVRVPADTFSVTSSFFLGMFGDSIRSLGPECFTKRYKFEGRDIHRVVADALDEAVKVGSPLRPS